MILDFLNGLISESIEVIGKMHPLCITLYIKKDGSDFRIPKMEWDEKLKEYIVHESVENDEFVSYPIDDNGGSRR